MSSFAIMGFVFGMAALSFAIRNSMMIGYLQSRMEKIEKQIGNSTEEK